MTDRIKGFTVALGKDMREDDCQQIINAILMIRGIENVTPLITSNDDWLARQHVKAELRESFYEFIERLT